MSDPADIPAADIPADPPSAEGAGPATDPAGSGAVEGPELSVVIPSVNGYGDLDGVLRALETGQQARLEIVVVDRLGEHVRHFLRRDHPQVTVLAVPGDTTIPQMRAAGIRRAGAPAVAVTEDHVIVPPGWARAMLDALEREGAEAVGGPVDNAATDSRIDWAAFLCEYSSTLPPLPAGPAEWLPGNNVIYRTETLRRHDAVLDQNRWEGALHDAIRAGGGRLVMCPEIVVGHKMHYSFGLYASQRYLYSRSYAGALARNMPPLRRAAMGAAALVLLPPLMFWRTIRRVRGRDRFGAELAPSLPLLVPFCLSWGAGEAAGYWFGPGRALEKVR